MHWEKKKSHHGVMKHLARKWRKKQGRAAQKQASWPSPNSVPDLLLSSWRSVFSPFLECGSPSRQQPPSPASFQKWHLQRPRPSATVISLESRNRGGEGSWSLLEHYRAGLTDTHSLRKLHDFLKLLNSFCRFLAMNFSNSNFRK